MHFNKQMHALCALLLLTVLLVSGSSSAAAAGKLLPRPAQREYVVDTAGMISAEDAAQIKKIGAELRTKTKAEIVVVTVPTLGDTDIETYANDLFRSFGIGDARMNNGVLLLIARDDRAFRIEVGYGLEGAITDGYAGSVLDAMKGEFRKENYSPAILQAYGMLAQKASSEYGAALESLGAALGIPAKPAHLGNVADFGELLMPEDAAQIERMGEELTNATGTQAVLVTVSTLKGADERQFAEQLFADWQLKDAAHGKSVLLLIAREERVVRLIFGPALKDMERDDDLNFVINPIKSEFSFDKDDLSKAIRKGYATLGVEVCEAAHVAVPDSIDEGASEPFYVYVLGFLIAIPLIGLLFYCFSSAFGLVWLLIASIVELVTLGKVKLLPSSSAGIGSVDNSCRDSTSGRSGSSGRGSSYGGGSSGGGGASGKW